MASYTSTFDLFYRDAEIEPAEKEYNTPVRTQSLSTNQVSGSYHSLTNTAIISTVAQEEETRILQLKDYMSISGTPFELNQ